MKRIDRETVQRILDAADIVEVVSDFVNLKKRGANYIGLCPFHNERTPSFSVSRAKGICKCFSCGKGGSPLNFIMEHEQLSYYEALKYLAKKYNIEIKEHELTDEEKERASERESLMAVNDFALEHFCHNLTDTPDGRDIGLTYFRERGINDLMIKKFKLGYSLDKPDALLKAALQKGYTEAALISTGLCSKNDRGTVYDRFRGRVMYPIFTVSGRVVAFGGRTLRTDKSVAKYVNSPESIIYHKSSELYGIYQAKSAIVKHNKCILVEGYMDVISMHQAGVENVVASSGTSLTEGQIRLIHRFTDNVTLIYDADAAGIKASLRGIDMLLVEGLNIKVLLLPEGEDPDSFAQSHSSAEVEKYIAENETDFMRFKTNILLKDVGNDPTARARVITDIVRSISVIPDTITKAVYLKECSTMLGIDEKVLALQVSKIANEALDRKQRMGDGAQQAPAAEAAAPTQPAAPATNQGGAPKLTRSQQQIVACERQLAKYIVKYGLLPLAAPIDQDEEQGMGDEITVLGYIDLELKNDEIELFDPISRKIYDDALEAATKFWPSEKDAIERQLAQAREEQMRQGHERIRQNARSMDEIETMEMTLHQECDEAYRTAWDQAAMRYLEEMFLSCPDDEERRIATDMASEKYQLSKVHTKYSHVETEQERLPDLVERGVLELKFAILEYQIAQLNQSMKEAAMAGDNAMVHRHMQDLYEMYQLKSQFAKVLGDRIVSPRR